MIMDIKSIVTLLKNKGAVVAIKTDTVYGLICNAFDLEAVNRIYDIKKREKKKPLSIFVKDIDDIKKYVSNDNLTKKNIEILKKYWPGALTVVFKKKDDTFSHITEGATGIGIRIPNDNTILGILNTCDFPLAETSCNISGEEPYKDYSTIKEKFGESVDLIVDGGRIRDSKPSTVISVESGNLQVVRQGEIRIEF